MLAFVILDCLALVLAYLDCNPLQLLSLWLPFVLPAIIKVAHLHIYS